MALTKDDVATLRIILRKTITIPLNVPNNPIAIARDAVDVALQVLAPLVTMDGAKPADPPATSPASPSLPTP